MKALMLISILTAMTESALAMPCDTGWMCKSRNGFYSIEVQRCRYTNSIGNLISVKASGHDIPDAKITAAYDSKSIGGSILAMEVSIPDTVNAGHYLSFEMVGKVGRMTERIQQFNPGEQKVIATRSLSCKVTE